MSLSNSSPSTSSPTNSHSPMQSLVGGMSGIWSYVVRLSNSPLDENEETPFNARAKIRLELCGFQYKKIISNLVATNSGCVLNANLYLNGVAIPSGSSLFSINGYEVLYCKYETIVDLLYMLRDHGLIQIVFQCIPSEHPSASLSSITVPLSVPSCIIFLLPNYHSLLPNSRKRHTLCRRNLIRNHYFSLQLLSQVNPNLALSSILSPLDLEHLLVADRLLYGSISVRCSPPPFTSEMISQFYQGNEQNAYFHPSLGNLRLIVEEVGIREHPALLWLLRYMETVYRIHHILPSIELVARICEVPDLFFISTLALSLPFLLHDQRQLWLSSLLLQTISHQSAITRFSSIGNGQSVLSLLHACHTREEVMTTLSQHYDIHGIDLLYAALQCCEEEQGGLLDEGTIGLIAWCLENFTNLPSSAERIRSIRVIIDLLTPGQRRALYWLTSLLRNTTEVNQEELIIKCAGQVAAGKYIDRIQFFLQFCIHYQTYLFFPTIPQLTQTVDMDEMDMHLFPCLHESIVRPAFSMKQTFQQMHSMAGQFGTRMTATNLDEVYTVPDRYEETQVVCDRLAEWNRPWNDKMV